MIKRSILLIFLIALASCATHGPGPGKSEALSKKAHLSKAEIEEMNKKAFERVSERLGKLSIAAKASGPDKVRYLASDMYLKASAALMEGDFQTANLIFEHLVKLEPKDYFIKQKYAISLIRTGELNEAKILLEDIFKKSGKSNSKVGLVLAGVYSSLGSRKKSEVVYKQLLKVDKHNEEACVFLAKSYALNRKSKKAINLLKKCERRDKGKGIYSYYIGKIFVDKKDYKKAKKYFAKATKAEPEFSQATMALGLIYEELGQWKRARSTYKKFLKKSPEDTIILSRLVQLLFTKERFTEVIQYAEKLSDYEPDNLNLKVKLGILYTDVKRFDKAVKVFNELLSFAPKNDKILYYLGAIYQETSEFEKAIETFTRIPVKSALYQDSSLQIAHMLSSLAQHDFRKSNKTSKAHLRFVSFVNSRIKKIKTFKVNFSVIKASYFESVEDSRSAITSLELVQSEKEFNDDHKFYLAALYEKERQFDRSSEVVKSILDNNPKNAQAWNFLGYSLLERKIKLDQAYKYISKAIKLEPNDGYIRDSLGWYYFTVGNTKKALKELRAAIKKVPSDIAVNKHLAIVYSSLRRFKKAKIYIKKALSEAKSDGEKKELVNALKEIEQKRFPASLDQK